MCFTTWEWWRRRWWWCFTKVTTYLFISLWKKCYGLRQQKLGHKIVCRQILWPVWTAVMVWSRVTQYCYFVNFLLLTLTNCINAHDGSHYCHVFFDDSNTNRWNFYLLMNVKKLRRTIYQWSSLIERYWNYLVHKHRDLSII